VSVILVFGYNGVDIGVVRSLSVLCTTRRLMAPANHLHN
jgi:hypothetical protein